MGKGIKKQPQKLPEKLLKIRKFFSFSQEEMIEFVSPENEDRVAARAAISDYERGRRTPSLIETLNYARAVRLFTRHKQFSAEDLIDDRKQLPFA
jgi:predicted transcriptional regulator